MQLGRDEQSRTAPVVNLINPTDLDQITKRMYDLIREYYNWDWINPQLQYRIGGGPLWFGLAGEPIREFLTRLILEMRKRERSLLKAGSIAEYKTILKNKYGYSDKALSDYFRALRELIDAGHVPESISHPWDYQPTSIGEDVGNVVAGKLGLYLLAGIAIYGLSTTIIPQIAKAR